MEHPKSSKREEQISRFLSKILRHQAIKMGFKIGSDGYLSVDELLAHPSVKNQKYTLEDLHRIVANNDKQRFSMTKRGEKWFIRANQGHSFEIPDLDLTPITDSTKYPIVVHGTYFQPLPTILKDGLSIMGRTHIHFTTGEFGDKGVISGMRKSAEVLIYIDLEKALHNGLKFYISANGVILSPGDETGYISPKYFSKVLRAHDHQPLN